MVNNVRKGLAIHQSYREGEYIMNNTTFAGSKVTQKQFMKGIPIMMCGQALLCGSTADIMGGSFGEAPVAGVPAERKFEPKGPPVMGAKQKLVAPEPVVVRENSGGTARKRGGAP